MSHHTLLEECEGPYALCAVNNLVWDYEVARSDLFLERADGREGDDGAYTNVSQRSDIGLILDLVRRVFMVEAVS